MPKKDFYHDIDMAQHALLKAVLDPVVALPIDPVVGQVCTYQGLLRWWNGSAWMVAGGLGGLQGAFDASGTELPSGASTGDFWFVEVGGDIDGMIGESLSPGDIIIAADGAAHDDPANWIFIYLARDQATETVYGVVRIATVEQVRAGEDHTRAVTPYGLHHMKADQAEALDEEEDSRFLTPKGLRYVTATEDRKGIIRVATPEEVAEGEEEGAAVTPATLGAHVGEMPERQDITQVPLHQLKLRSADETVWIITVSNAGVLQVTEDEGES